MIIAYHCLIEIFQPVSVQSPQVNKECSLGVRTVWVSFPLIESKENKEHPLNYASHIFKVRCERKNLLLGIRGCFHYAKPTSQR